MAEAPPVVICDTPPHMRYDDLSSTLRDDEAPLPPPFLQTLRDEEQPPTPLLRTLREEPSTSQQQPLSPHGFDDFDEESRFSVHRGAKIDDSMQRLYRVRGVRSATVIELATGAIITSTADAAAVAALAEHVPPLLARARACSSTVGAEELSLLLVSSRRSELLICGDAVSGTAVVVEQDRVVGALPETLLKQPEEDDAETRYRRLLVGSLSQSPGDFASQLFDDDGDDDPP